MHANLHSEFLQSVSTTNRSRRTSNNKNVAGNCASKLPTQSTVPKRHGVINEPKKNIGTKRKLGTKLPPNSAQVQIRKLNVSGGDLHGSKPSSLKKVDISSKEKNIPNTQIKRVGASVHPKDSSGVPLSINRKDSVIVNSKTSKTKTDVSSRKLQAQGQGRDLVRNNLGTQQNRSVNNQINKDYKITSAKSKTKREITPKDTSSANVSVLSKANPVKKRVEKSKYKPTCDEKFSNKMDTIKEEESKEVVLIDKGVSKKYNRVTKGVTCQSNLESTQIESSKQTVEATNSETVMDDKKRKELQKLEEIEKEFVAFLLPWLKLVPTMSSREANDAHGNKVSKEKHDTKSNRSLNNYLNSLSKVQ